MDLEIQAMNFVSAAALFGFCAQNRAEGLFSDWMGVAGRDGALTLNNYSVVLSRIRKLVGQIPTWLPQVDAQTLKRAATEFDRAFPFAQKLRHSVAHPEIYNNPNKKMGIDGPFELAGVKADGGPKNATFRECIDGFTFISTFAAFKSLAR